MIKAKVAAKPHVLVVFDKPRHANWMDKQRVTIDGLYDLLSPLVKAGIDTKGELSVVCLADVKNPKAKDFNEKADYVKDLIEAYAFNVVVPVGAKAFERIMGHKGIDRYLGQAIWSEPFQCKVVPCPNPSMVHFKPEIKEVLEQTATMVASQKNYPELIEKEKMAVTYTVIDTIGKFDKLMEVLEASEKFTFDLETSGFHFKGNEILTAQFSHKPGFSYLIPTDFYDAFWAPTEWAHIKRGLVKLFQGVKGSKRLCGHNLKFDLKFAIHHWGIPCPQPENLVDTMVMSFLVDENSPNDLKFLACRLTDLGDYEFELEAWKDAYCKKHKIKKGEFSYSVIPFDILAPYALTDTDATFRVWDILEEQLAIEEQQGPFAMLMEFLYTTLHMEMNGWPVDLDYAQQYLKDLSGKIEQMEIELLQEPLIQQASEVLATAALIKENEKRVNKLAELKEPFVFNMRSSQQKQVLFFDIMKLPVIKFTKAKDANGKRTTPAADKEVMENWITNHQEHEPLLSRIQTYNELCKMRSTYVEAIIHKTVNGFIHPLYNIIGAKTGRLSSREPNFQNLPVRNAEAKNVKRIIKAPPGWVLLGADLSAAEMRWACICSGDPKLIEVFGSGVDAHGAIAKEVFNLDCHPNEVKVLYPELRDIAKTIQFLSLYGGGADTLMTKIKIKKKRAIKILHQLLEEFGMAELVGEADGNPVYKYDLNLIKKNAENAAIWLMNKFQFEPEKAVNVVTADDKPTALMEAFTVTRDQSQELLDQYFLKYSGLTAFINGTTEFTKRTGYSLSLLGRKRRVPAVKANDKGLVERSVRQAVNSTIQSIASDGLMISAYKLLKHLQETGEARMKLMGPIHDAIYCMVREDFVLEAKELLCRFMTAFPDEVDSPIPMLSDAEWGYDWAHFSEDFSTGGFEELHQEDEELEEEERLAA